MRIRIETSDSEEIVIRCREKNDRTKRLELAIEEALTREDTITLLSDGADCFVPKGELLYFESSNGAVYAHTKDKIYTAPYKLWINGKLVGSDCRSTWWTCENRHYIVELRKGENTVILKAFSAYPKQFYE